jgi:hypothetical protein
VVVALVIATALAPVGSIADPDDTTHATHEAVVGGHGWLQATHIVPPYQPPLVILGERGVAPVHDAFRAADGEPRIVLLMSPT